jgi:CheY-like chemotaxis protein
LSHVLLIEDDAMNARVIRTVLARRCECRVTVTEDADEVMDLVASGDVRLVIMDVSLANTRWQGRPVNGVELCRILKNDPRTREVPVMLATAHAMRGDAQELLTASGADDYVAKPIVDHGVFADQVRGWIARAA